MRMLRVVAVVALLALTTAAAFAASPSATVKLSLNASVRALFGHERAVGTATMHVPPGWKFVRFGRPASPPNAALYSVPDADGCHLSGELELVSVLGTTSPSQALPHGQVVASGKLHGGAWEVVSEPDTRDPLLLTASTVVFVAHHRALLARARIDATCRPGTQATSSAVTALEVAAKSVRPHIRVEHHA
jgi:hypothetical protein